MTVGVAVVTGPIGVGKTTTVAAMGELLEARGVAHTTIDMDWLRASFPRPPDDRFNVELGFRNLADVARNSMAAGSACFVLADVVETREQRERYREAIPDADVVIVRLVADPDRVLDRIGRRAIGDPDPWEAERSAELAAMMAANAVADITVETTDRSPREVAEEVLRALGWGAVR